jgi:hypothetical protein
MKKYFNAESANKVDESVVAKHPPGKAEATAAKYPPEQEQPIEWQQNIRQRCDTAKHPQRGPSYTQQQSICLRWETKTMSVTKYPP